MQSVRFIPIAVFLVFAYTASFGAEGKLEAKGDVRLQQATSTHNGEVVLNRKEVNVSANYRLTQCSAKVALRTRSDAHLAPTHVNYTELREATIECLQDDWLFAVGRQAVVWGKVDNFRVLDVIHPFDYRESLLDDKESARRPLTMLRIERQMTDSNAVQFLLITERREDILPKPGDRFFSLYPQAALESISTSHNKAPDWVLNSLQAGFKWEHTGQQIGYTINALRHWAPQPSYTNQGDGTITRNMHRQTMLGGSVDLSLSEWVLRGEVAYLPQVYLPTKSSYFEGGPEYQRYGQVTWAIGADRSIGEWLLNAQLLQTRIIGASPALLTDREQRVLSIAFSRHFLQDHLKLRTFAARDIRDGGNWVSASATYDILSDWELSANLDIMNGSSASIFGIAGHESRLKIGVLFRF